MCASIITLCGSVSAADVPSANFTANATNGSGPLTIQFNDTSTGNPTSWYWDFGDKHNSTLQNPTHTYTSLGNFTVTLNVSNDAGSSVTNGTIAIMNSSSFSNYHDTNIFVANANGVKYDVPDGASNHLTYIYVPDSYFVDFEQPGGGLNPIHISTDPTETSGQVTTTSDQSGTFWITFTGGQPTMPDAILMLAVNGTIPDDFALTLQSSGYTWDMNPPAVGNDFDTNNLIYVTDALNETFNSSDFIYGPQLWKFCSSADYPLYNGEDMSDTNNTFQIMFIDLDVGALQTGINGGAIEVNYNFTDLQSFAAFNVYGWYSASNHGTGIIMTNSLTGGNSGYNVVGTPPVANFTATTTPDVAAPVQFTDNSYAPDSWYWDFGDGTTSTLQNPSHTYTAPGTYTVTLTVTNAFGNNTMEQNITKIIPPTPVANFTSNVTSGISPLTVQFYDNSTNNPLTWYWDFGDGTNSTQQNPTHSYTTPGNYNVSLTVTNGGGSNNLTETNYITVYYPPPIASFTANTTTGIAPVVVNFTDTSTGNITSYYWNFGDGTNSTLQNPSHIYTPGTYTVSEIVTGPGGNNTSTLTNYIYVKYPAPVASFLQM